MLKDSANHCLCIANQFYKASTTIDYNHMILTDCVFPLVVNLHFSCELYLKSILMFKKCKTHGHDLSKLYQKLEKE